MLHVERAIYCKTASKLGANDGRNEDETIQVLTIERSKVSPKKRFGLGWFIPALKQHCQCFSLDKRNFP